MHTLTILHLLLSPAYAITLDVPAFLVEDAASSITVSDAAARRTVFIAVGRSGLGAGPCPAALQGDCLDVVAPFTVLERRADAAGEVSLTVNLPSSQRGQSYCLQAVTVTAAGAQVSEAQCTEVVLGGTELVYNGHDYLFTTTRATFDEAAALCAARAMRAVHLDDEAELTWVVDQHEALGNTGVLWSDLTDAASEGTWLDTYGDVPSYAPWASWEPDNFLGAEHCAIVRPAGFDGRADEGLGDGGCGDAQTVVCEADGAIDLYRNHVYLSVSTHRAWEDAQAVCADRGGSLITIDDADENAWFDLLADAMGHNTWLGLTDLASEGTWLTPDGSAAPFTFWGAGEPNDAGGGEDCAHRWSFNSGGWNDAGCSSEMASVCEIE